MDSTYAEQVRSVRLVARTMGKRDDVTQLVPSDEGDYVYALTEQQVNHVNIKECQACRARAHNDVIFI